MGEKVYTMVSNSEKEYWIIFSEGDDHGCLCTFPDNDMEQMSTERIKSLAIFGAAVRLAMDDYFDGPYIFLPDALPKWILKGILGDD